ncbi:alanine--tRNA ligase [Fusobacterium perfoetens]|uniref:alanine--tRNA ligase n=1 Tax=Fusobacterium perfoetens TaxID=852 RepID=UPI0015A1C770|nr:alanine--tRNA ligase [Fusobacterium perfoetens]MCF2626055.1 alanine--tRNA ligase [Fusobacterium perfoetens]
MLTGNEVRAKFIEFFESKNHKHFESASLIPDDQTLLLTVAGMVPFKPYFLGQKEAPTPRVTTFQKCIRTNDLENVGRTARHHTFFEMLGNFSFGDYFKKESIKWSYEFITEVLKIEKERLWVSVFETDDEAEELWVSECNFPRERIVRFGEEDNWWAAGPTGSCGPCSEIYVDLGVEFGGDENSRLGDADTDNRFIEIWNLVFTEWNRMEDGHLEPLPKKNIDTGAGLERITAVVQGKPNNFETDLLFPIIEEMGRISGVKYGTDPKKDFSLKVIADHSRAVTFLVNDGVIPSNEGRGYVLRRVLRRAIRHGRLLGVSELFLYKIVDTIVELMKGAYPDLVENAKHIKKVIKIEEEKFSNTLDSGIQQVMAAIEEAKKNGESRLTGDVTFKLYDTYGFPYELTEEICEENGITIYKNEFDQKMEEQKEKARSSREVVMEKGQDAFIEAFFDEHGKTEFTGYESLEETAKVLHVSKLDEEGMYMIITDKTPFYAESGGQQADNGVIEGNGALGQVVDVQKQKNIFMHTVKVVNGVHNFFEGAEVKLVVNGSRRDAISKNHSATHLLQKALREILGTHVQQAGSLVAPDRLRFDFNHYEAMTDEELEKVERLVNAKISEALPADIKYMNMEEAKKTGAMALFGDKYESVVRVVSFGDFSTELCGGIHVSNVSQIGLFKIISETGVAAGVRRIEAKTGFHAYEAVKDMERTIKNVADSLKTDVSKVEEKAEKTSEDLRSALKEIEELKSKIAAFEAGNLFEQAEEINGVKVLVKGFKDKESDSLREIVDKAKDKLGSCIVVLGADNGKAIFTVGVTKDLTSKVKAGDIVKELAVIAGGNGGGRPDFAQAGGKDGSKVMEALESVKKSIREKL